MGHTSELENALFGLGIKAHVSSGESIHVIQIPESFHFQFIFAPLMRDVLYIPKLIPSKFLYSKREVLAVITMTE